MHVCYISIDCDHIIGKDYFGEFFEVKLLIQCHAVGIKYPIPFVMEASHCASTAVGIHSLWSTAIRLKNHCISEKETAFLLRQSALDYSNKVSSSCVTEVGMTTPQFTSHL